MQVSDVFKGLVAQQIPALIGILRKGQQFAQEEGIDAADLWSTRLAEDMHPLLWQIQTSMELCLRGASRLLNQEPVDLEITSGDFDQVIEQVEAAYAELKKTNFDELDSSADKIYEIPVGPDATLSLSGKDYVLKFLLPNVYFHLTTTYALLRQRGVDLGKRDFMGPF